jgi:hypothetical protein
VCRDPVIAPARLSGWHYQEIVVLRSGASIAPLARPDTPVEVAAILPRSGCYVR